MPISESDASFTDVFLFQQHKLNIDMNNNKEESKCLASLAVFRELYNKQKDVYGVISEFLNEIISSNGMHQFTIKEISNLLNITYDFSIPDAVVRTAVGRLDYLEKEQGIYIVVRPLESKSGEVSLLQKETKSNNDIIIESLFDFIQTEKKSILTETEKNIIEHSFCSFLLDNANGEKYAEYISAFFVNNKTDLEFRKRLNKIREGVVLYSGLKYNNNLNDLGSWKTELTIYLDTEILFHFVGYNGEVYKALFNDFYDYVKEINRKSTKKLIQLRYLNNVKTEMDGFFTKAKYIKEGKERLSPKGTAMNSIVEGCNEPSDIEDKKSDFYLLLKTNDIKEDETIDYFNDSNFAYNIINQAQSDILSKEMEHDISEHLRTLNLISIKRNKACSNNFDNIGSILLTGNSKTLKVAWHEQVKPEGSVPLATTLSFLTNKFWFKLNKGFGDGAFPKSFDIITKAQILLSSELNESIGDKYEELQIQFKAGKLTEDQAKARIVNLRSQVRKPEDIVKDDVLSILDVISEDSLEQFIQEQEHFKNEASKQANENIQLKETLELKAVELENKEKEALKFKNEKEQKELEIITNTIIAKESLLEEKIITKEILLRQMTPIEIEALKTYINFKIGIGIILISLYAIVCLIIWKMGWSIIEAWTYVAAILLSNLLPMIYLLIYERNINPKNYLVNKKSKIFKKTFLKFNFDIERLKTLENETSKLKDEIKELKKPAPNRAVCPEAQTPLGEPHTPPYVRFSYTVVH